MDLFTYLMAKKGHNTGRDLFSYLLGKNAGGSGTYTTFSGISLNISNTVFGKIKNFMLNSTELTQDGTPSPDNPVDVNVIKGENNIEISRGNLLNILNINSTFSGVQVTTNSDKSITLNGTATSNYAINIITNWSLTLEKGKTYTLSGCPDLGGKDVLSIELYSNSPTSRYITDIGNGITFTLNEERTFRCYIAIKAGQTYDNVTLYPALEEDVSQNYPISLSSKNLFDKDTAIYKNGYYRNNSGEEVSTTISGYTTSFMSVKPNTTYTISGKIRTINMNGAIYCYDVSKNWIERQGWTGEDTTSFTFTTPNNCYYIQFQYTMEIFDTTTVQLEVGSTATTYEPYYNIEYCKIGDYADQISNKFESKNIFDEDKLNLNKTTDDNKQVYIIYGTSGEASINYLLKTTLEENTQYTLSFVGKQNKYFNTVVFKYTDGTNSTVRFTNSDYQRCIATSQANKTINGIQIDTGAYSAQNYIEVGTIQLEKGTTATEYVPYYNIDYCKIGDYADQIFKNTTDSEFYDNTLIENEWYLKKKIGKIDSYNGETITTPYISTTGGLDTGATVYYGLETPTYIHISQTDYPTLKTELDNLYNNAQSYNGQTNITQTNDDLPFNISADVKVKEEG